MDKIKTDHKIDNKLSNESIYKKVFKLLPFTKRDPITSYGIILFYIDSDKKIWYLLAQRRDTIEYADYLRGRYAQGQMELYLSLITIEERERLLKYSFEDLWRDLWINTDNKYARDIKDKAHTRFESNKKDMIEILQNTRGIIKEPGWVFPKGKKNLGETDLECSFREFSEETRISLDYVNLLTLPPLKEIFKGSNGQMYSTIYYIAEIDSKMVSTKLNINGIRKETISEEISNLRWCTLHEALSLFPTWRQKVLLSANEKIKIYKIRH